MIPGRRGLVSWWRAERRRRAGCPARSGRLSRSAGWRVVVGWRADELDQEPVESGSLSLAERPEGLGQDPVDDLAPRLAQAGAFCGQPGPDGPAGAGGPLRSP